MNPELVHAYRALRQLSFGDSLSVQEVSLLGHCLRDVSGPFV